LKHLRERDEEGEQSLQRFHVTAERVDRRDRVLLKNEEERSVFEEVFDRQTLMILYSMSNNGLFSYLNGAISSGKEARVYWGVDEKNANVAVKIYLVASSDYKKRLHYVVGDPRFRKIRKDSRGIAELWARKEFINLQQAEMAGVRVPHPRAFEGNVLVMDFVGEDGIRAPRLYETKVTKSDYESIIRQLRLLYSKAKLVHCDISEFNILKLGGEIILFDFGSGVSIEHPSADEYLKRDIGNLNRFFSKQGIRTITEEKLFARISGKRERKIEATGAEQ